MGKKKSHAKARKGISYTLLQNGLDFIWEVLAHLSRSSKERRLKYAVLHLCSGIELVLKERLRIEHWTLVFEEPKGASKEAYETGNFSSASFKSCITRLKTICGVSISDKQERRLLAFRDKRNRLEHFGIEDSAEAIIALAAVVLNFILDFINTELEPGNLDPDDTDTLDAIRQKLSEFDEFVEKRNKLIEGQLKATKTAVVTCPSCGQDAALVSEGARCLFCGYRSPPEKAAEEYVSNVLGKSYYGIVKDGGRWPIFECPECELETCVDRGPTGDPTPSYQYICFSCGGLWKEGDFDSCSNCGELFLDDGESAGICGNCWREKFNAP